MYARVNRDAELAPLYEQIVRNVCREVGVPYDPATQLLPQIGR